MTEAPKNNASVLGIAGGGALAVIGPMLPWLSITTGFGSISRSGFDYGGDAIIIAIVGFVVALAAVGTLTGNTGDGWVKAGGIVAGLIVVGLVANDHLQLQDRLDDNASDFVIGSIGAGVWLTYAAGLLLLAGGLSYKRVADATEDPASID